MYQRLKCQDIQANSHSNPDTSYFCTDNEDISEETFQDFSKWDINTRPNSQGL